MGDDARENAHLCGEVVVEAVDQAEVLGEAGALGGDAAVVEREVPGGAHAANLRHFSPRISPT